MAKQSKGLVVAKKPAPGGQPASKGVKRKHNQVASGDVAASGSNRQKIKQGGQGKKGQGKGQGKANGKGKGKGKGKQDGKGKVEQKEVLKEQLGSDKPSQEKGKAEDKGKDKATAPNKGKGKGKGKGKDGGKQKEATGGAGSKQDKKKKEVKCRLGHVMGKRTDNPKGYKQQACCDLCGVPDLPRKQEFFFHCSFCRWDCCPNCSKKTPDRPEKKKKKKGAAAEGSAEPTLEGGDAAADMRADEASKEDQMWVPTEDVSTNRAPLKSVVVSDWVEGVPL